MGNSLTSFNIPQLSAAILVCRGTKYLCVLRDTCLTIRSLRESEVRTDKNQRCSDPRVEPEKHRWVTVSLHVRATIQYVFKFIDCHRRDRRQSTCAPLPKKNNFAADIQVFRTSNTSTTKKCKCSFPLAIELYLIHANPLRKTRWKSHQPKIKAHSLKISLATTNAASLLCRQCATWRKRRPLPRKKLSTNRNLEGREVCTDKNQRCSDSRSGPEKQRLVTV